MRQFEYATSCVSFNGDVSYLHEMKDSAVSVTYRTIRERCVGLLEWAIQLGYERDSRLGLTLKEDSCVGFYRGKLKGKRCYFVAWSGIEFVWVEKEKHAA